MPTKRQLQFDLEAANRRIARLEEDLDAARNENGRLRRNADQADRRTNAAEKRARRVLAIVTNGKDNLALLFGSLSDLGTDEADVYQRYSADDQLALVHVDPATGRVRVSDPNNDVDEIEVYFDEEGNLDPNEQREIRRFRADVLLVRQVTPPPINGVVSLGARNSQRDALVTGQPAASDD